MTSIQPIGVNNSATYNAVKIKVNNPQANINKALPNNNGTYNSVAIEVNNPKINTDSHKHKCIYDYPTAECPACKEMVESHSIGLHQMPVLPIAYSTNFINNRTLINAEVEVENNKDNNAEKETKLPEVPVTGVIIKEEIISVPEENYTTTEEQKEETGNVSFNGLSFKAENKNKIEIVPPKEIKPEINVPNILKNLQSDSFDIQAKQMEEIAKTSMENPKNAVPFIITEIFTELMDIVKKDTSNLTPPSEKQIELRKQIIVNEIIKEQAKAQKQDINKIQLPYKLTEQDLKDASNLSSLEQAERNKEYALYTMAILAKVYTDEVQKQTGNIVPLTDLPGVSSIVDALRFSSNSGVKIAAIDALRYLNRPEYKQELDAVLMIAANDSNTLVARTAAVALESIEK